MAEITKKHFTFRGKTLEELQKLDVREFAKFAKSRQRRIILRQFQEIEKFITRAKIKIAKNKSVKTHSRDLVIVPAMVGMRLNIHNGRSFVPVDVIGEMLGHEFGEFAMTRVKVKHGGAGIGATKGTKHKAKK